jgi:uncharacterized phiE125 gp8 family phage protein
MTSILLTVPDRANIARGKKTFLRVEHDDEDQLIAALIAGARNHIEAQTQTAMESIPVSRAAERSCVEY